MHLPWWGGGFGYRALPGPDRPVLCRVPIRHEEAVRREGGRMLALDTTKGGCKLTLDQLLSDLTSVDKGITSMLFGIPGLGPAEQHVLGLIDDLRNSLKYASQTPRRWPGLLRRVLFAKAIQSSNSIEGYNVTLEDALAAAENEERLDSDLRSWQAVAGYRRAMTYALGLAEENDFGYSEDLIRALHFMMMEYDLTKEPGRYRRGFIYIRQSNTGEIVYEGAEAERVPGLMTELVESLNAAGPMPPLVRAAMAHLNLVLIHPFKDGNGRLARCLQTLVLGREGILEPEFCSIEEYLGRNTAEYYKVIGEVGGGYWQPENDARPWIRFCLTAHYRQAKTVLRRMKESERLWELLSSEVEKRRLPERVSFALFDAARGLRVRRSTYQPVAEVSDNLASRDFKLLVDSGLLQAHGEKRGRFYTAAPALQEIRNRSLEIRLPIADPFEEFARAEESRQSPDTPGPDTPNGDRPMATGPGPRMAPEGPPAGPAAQPPA